MNVMGKRCRAGLIAMGLILMAAALMPGAALAAKAADTVYLNGNIYTVDDKQPKASAVAITGQKLVYVGNDKGAKSYVGKKTKVVDLKGKTVLPGLIEGHMHYTGEGQKMLQVYVFWSPKAEILAKVKAETEKLPAGTWIIGRGWNQEVWPDKKFPTKEELDTVAPNHPVMLTRTCGHAIWVNSKALAVAGVDKNTPNPAGGTIDKDANGNPTGILHETARNLVRSKVTPMTNDRLQEAMLKAQDEMFSFGITSVMSAGTSGSFSSVLETNLMKELYEKGQLKVRIYNMINEGEDAKVYYKKGPEIGLYGDRLTVRSIKFYADGSLGARSALLLEPYSDKPGEKGVERMTYDALYKGYAEARKNGFQVSTHAIGDGANRRVVDLYEKVLKEQPLKDHRYRIEHFQVATALDIDRIAKLKIVPAMQGIHATSDKNMAENRVGAERIKYAYAWRKVIKAGSVIVNGSDAPVEPVNPYWGLYASVTRMDNDGKPEGGWYIGEGMTREEALKSFTIWAAYGQFEEKIKGSLQKGKLADLVVIDRDYMKIPAKEIKDIKALLTVLGGEEVYKSPELK